MVESILCAEPPDKYFGIFSHLMVPTTHERDVGIISHFTEEEVEFVKLAKVIKLAGVGNSRPGAGP